MEKQPVVRKETGVKLPAPAFAEAASRRQAQGGASGKCRFDYRVGFPPRLPAYRQAGKAGHPADLPVNLYGLSVDESCQTRNSSAPLHALAEKSHRTLRYSSRMASEIFDQLYLATDARTE